MRTRSYTDDQVREAVAESPSYRQALMKLGLAPAGGNYATLKRIVHDLGIDTDHFLGQGHYRGKKFGPKRPLDTLLIRGSTVQSYKLKRHLLEEGIMTHRCMRCDRTRWEGRSIPLELHHIDGDRSNNVLSNLELLCPNCHALTDTYRGRNINRS